MRLQQQQPLFYSDNWSCWENGAIISYSALTVTFSIL